MSLTEQLFGGNAKAETTAAATTEISQGEEHSASQTTGKGLKFAKGGVNTAELFKKVSVPVVKPDPKKDTENHAAAGKKHKHLSHARDEVDPDEVKRTVFVSNLPNTVQKNDLKKHFLDCGAIESVRIRCIHLKAMQGEKNRGRAVRILRGEIDEDPRHSATAYIVFENVSSVEAALNKSGSVFKGRHLSIGREESDAKAFLPKFSVFLGNLAYDISDEEVWQYFLDRNIKDVDRVRVIRDRETGAAKGIGYVSFRSSASVQRAIDVREQDLKGRPLRIAHVQKPKDPKLAIESATRREKRRLLHQKAVMENGPQLAAKAGKKQTKKEKAAAVRGDEHKTSGRREDAAAVGIAEMPSWMGVTTNPRKKLAAELRVLTQSNADRKRLATQKRKEQQQKVRDARKKSNKRPAGGDSA